MLTLAKINKDVNRSERREYSQSCLALHLKAGAGRRRQGFLLTGRKSWPLSKRWYCADRVKSTE